MAVTLTDHRLIPNEADSTTNWVGSATVVAGTTDPTPVESTGWVGANVGAVIFDGYATITSDDYSNAVVYCWTFSRLALGNTTDANGGLMVLLGDGTNRGAWKVNGADKAPFRHDDGPTGWACAALDTTARPANPLSRAGSAASVNFGAITDVGTTVNSLVAAPGMNPTYNMDIIRVLDITDTGFNNCAISVTGGTSGDPGTFAQIAAADRLTGNQQANGLVRQLAAGAFGCQGPIRFGNATGSSPSWFQDSNAVFVFESRGFRTTLYKIFITDNGTGTTTFILTNCSLIAPSGVGASWDSLTDTDVTDVTITGTRIEGFTGGVGVGGGLGQIFTNCIFSNGGAVSVTSQRVTLTSSSVLTSTVAADASALVWNVATNPDGYLDSMTFSKGTNAHHAIGFGTSSPTTMTLRGINFSGFNASNGQNDSTLRFLRTTGTITVNLIGCSGNISYKKEAGATVNLVSNPVSLSIHVQNINTAAAIVGARVWVPVTSTASGRPFNQAISSITRAGAIATVTFAADHNLATNDYLNILGCDQPEYNNTFQVTVTGLTTLEVTVSGTPASGSGTMVGTWVIISDVTNGSGDISASYTYAASQPISGRVRASSDPYYKTAPISGTVNSSSGLSLTIQMIPD